MIDKWLDAIDDEDDVKKLDPEGVRDIDTIIDSFVEIAIVGLDKQPEQWTDKIVGEIMFSRFLLILEDGEKTSRLYDLIPFALKKLFNYLGKKSIIKNNSHLIDWVNINAKALQNLYNPDFENFYRGLIKAMRREGINTNDKNAVDSFTKLYLQKHPTKGINLFTKKDKK